MGWAPGEGAGREGSASAAEQAGADPNPNSSAALPLLRPGGPLCRAAPALWLGGLPARLPDRGVRGECGAYGPVMDLVRLQAPPYDEAFVVFADIRCGTHAHITALKNKLEKYNRSEDNGKGDG
jgi:hypothetical protein